MKKNVLVLVFVMVVLSFTGNLFSFANESKKGLDTNKEIILKGKMGKVEKETTLPNRNTQTTAIDIVAAFVEDDLVTICFDQAIENDDVSISIRNEFGDILFETMIIVEEAMEISIPIDIDDFTEHTLVIYSSEIDLEGEF